MLRRRSSRRRLLWLVTILLLTAAPDVAPLGHVTVNGETIAVRLPATAQATARAYGLRLRARPLVAVDGTVVDRARFGPRYLVDDQPISASSYVKDGSRLVAIHGRSQVEPFTEQRVPIPAPWPGIERTLSNPPAPGEAVMRTGKVSGRTINAGESAAPRPASPRTDRPEVALTFDDGPGPRTNEILDVIASRQVPATFFVVGSMVRKHGDVLQREEAMGMQIGNHSWTHRLDFASIDEATATDEIEHTDRDIAALLGSKPSLFRPPTGAMQPALLEAVRKSGKRFIHWTIDPIDYANPPPQVIVERVVSQLRPGAIVLLHDGGGAERTTPAALGALIDAIRTSGYTIVGLT